MSEPWSDFWIGDRVADPACAPELADLTVDPPDTWGEGQAEWSVEVR